MQKLLLSIITLSTIVITITACKKDDSKTIAQGNYEVYDFFQTHGVPVQHFTEDASGIVYIHTTGGAIIQFPYNAFQTVNGTIVTGIVDIEVREIYSKKDMILSNATTTSNDEIIDSRGELYIHASQNGEELFPRYPYQVWIPTWNTSPPYQSTMPLFYGQTINIANDSSVTNATALNWVQDTATFNLRIIDPNIYVYEGFPSRFGWGNCDFFYTNPNPKDSITAILPETFGPNNTITYFSIDGRNSTGYIFSVTGQPNKFRFRHVPIGTQLHIITISKINNQMYFGLAAATITPNCIVNITPQEITEDQIEVQLDNLP